MKILYIILLIIIILIIIYFIMWYRANTVVFSDISNNCLDTRWGCCKDKLTPKLDNDGTNCRGFYTFAHLKRPF